MDSAMSAEELHSIRSAARHCKVAPGTVRNWMLTGLLAYTKGNNRILIRQSDLDAVHQARIVARSKRSTKA